MAAVAAALYSAALHAPCQLKLVPREPAATQDGLQPERSKMRKSCVAMKPTFLVQALIGPKLNAKPAGFGDVDG